MACRTISASSQLRNREAALEEQAYQLENQGIPITKIVAYLDARERLQAFREQVDRGNVEDATLHDCDDDCRRAFWDRGETCPDFED